MITIAPNIELDFATHYSHNDCLVIRRTAPMKEGEESILDVAEKFANGIHGQIVSHPKGNKPGEMYVRVASREYERALWFSGKRKPDVNAVDDNTLKMLWDAANNPNF